MSLPRIADVASVSTPLLVTPAVQSKRNTRDEWQVDMYDLPGSVGVDTKLDCSTRTQTDGRSPITDGGRSRAGRASSRVPRSRRWCS